MLDKVLFVDDEPSVLEGYKRMLHREFEVDTAVSGEQGLTLIRDRGPYSVVISDMRMPGMNGAQFLAQVRQRAPDTIRMLLTASQTSTRQWRQSTRETSSAFSQAVRKGGSGRSHQRRGVSVPAVMVERELLEILLWGASRC